MSNQYFNGPDLYWDSIIAETKRSPDGNLKATNSMFAWLIYGLFVKNPDNQSNITVAAT